jgi:carbon monoxide dehydrogenase subunit G
MKLEQSFEVAAPVDRVWKALIDVEQVAPCLPGASVTGRNDDGSYDGSFTIKIGPTTAAYTGKLLMEEVDQASHTATMQANGTDKRGQGGASATIVSKLSETGGGTRVEVVTDYRITGRLARFGRGGMIEDISERLLRDFAQRLQESLSQPEGDSTPAGEVGATDGGSEEGVGSESEGVGSESEGVGSESEGVGSESEGVGSESPVGSAERGTVAAGALGGQPLPTHEAQPLDALPLAVSVLRDRIRANPLPVAALLGFLLAVLVRRRARGAAR